MNYGGHFDCDSKEEQIKKLESEINKTDFWNDKDNAEKVLKEVSELKEVVSSIKELSNRVNDNLDLINLIEEDYDEDIYNNIIEDGKTIIKDYNTLELLLLLNGKYDKENSIVEIHSGAGGTEACDWADMLYRLKIIK